MQTPSDEELFAAVPAPEPTGLEPAIAERDLSEEELAMMAELRALGGPFRVVDEGSAAWVVDKILSFDERKERLKEQFIKMMRGLEADEERFKRHFIPQLEVWFDAQPKKGKSLNLLTGTLARRTVKGGLRVADERQVLEWAEVDLPGAIITRSVKELNKGAVLAHVETTGEVVPGVERTEDRESFSVKGPKLAQKEV